MRRAILLIAALFVSACDPGGQTVAAPDAPVKLVANTTVGPGMQAVGATEAMALKDAMCTGTAPIKAAAANGFALNTNYRTYFHQTLNLSVKLTKSGCSLVFYSEDPEQNVRANLLQANGSEVKVSEIGALTYYRALFPKSA